MRWTLSKPCTMGGGRSVCRQDLGLVNTISYFLGLGSIEFKVIACGPLFDMLDLGFAGILNIGSNYMMILDADPKL